MDRNIILKYEKQLSRIYRVLFNFRGNRITRGNKLDFGSAFCRNLRFDVKGVNNEILFTGGGLTRMNNSFFSIHGSNNKIIIHSHVVIDDCSFCIEDDNNLIEIFDDTWINPKAEFAAIEGTRIIVGKNCMFSSCIRLRTGDSHSMLDQETKLRINRSKDIVIGDHVWIGFDALILKGSRVDEDSVVSARALLTGKHYPARSVIAGCPAAVIKSGISWDRSRDIPFARLLNKD